MQKPVDKDKSDSWLPSFYEVQDLYRQATTKFAESKAAKTRCNFFIGHM